jgi:pimeloyl-ACP methyl ester carboxylesterase
LEAVIDHLKLKRFALFGFSCAGSTAIAYAIKYPKRVSHLVLYDSYARGEAITTEEFKKSFSSLIRSAWGVGSKTLADMFLPGADVSALKWFTRLQREAATAEMASKLFDFSNIQVVKPFWSKYILTNVIMISVTMISLLFLYKSLPTEKTNYTQAFPTTVGDWKVTQDFQPNPRSIILLETSDVIMRYLIFL